jgi:CRISPR-associated endonuclease/helicase Cas3
MLSLEAVDAYFRELYWLRDQGSRSELDSHRIIERLYERAQTLDFEFESIARASHMIEDFMVPIIVPLPWDTTASRLLAQLEYIEQIGGIARSLQPYIVQVPPKARAELISVGAASVVQPERFGEQFVRLDNLDLYDADIGLHWGDPTFREPANLIV